MTVQADGHQVPAGISELLSLPDGTLLLAATATSGDPDHQSGSLWWTAAAASGVLNAVRIREFDGLKPEGLSLSPTPGRLVVAFDTGDDDPLWTELPWPTP
jgi:hypothetical protein